MGKLIRMPKPVLPPVGAKPVEIEPKPKPQSKTELTEAELYDLLNQYARWYYLKFKYSWKLQADQEDIFGELAVAALEALPKYKAKSDIRTYYISVFRNRMTHYRDYLHVRQVQWPMYRITMC